VLAALATLGLLTLVPEPGRDGPDLG